MPVDPESIANFGLGAVGDGFLGIVDLATNTLYLALAEPQTDNPYTPAPPPITPARHSRIGGVLREPLPGAGGHAILAGWVGIFAVQVGRGNARGNAFGFSIIKREAGSFTVYSFRSGFNQQLSAALPRNPLTLEFSAQSARTLPQQHIETILLPLLDSIGTRIIGNKGY